MAQNHDLVLIDHITLKNMIQEAVREVLQPKGKVTSCPDTILTPKQVARMLRISDQEVYAAVQDGSLKAVRRGRYWEVSQGDISRWKRVGTKR